MKKKQIIGIAIASLGALVSISGAAALYVTGAESIQFGIGQGDFVGSAGVVTYKINDAVDGTIAPQYWDTLGNDKSGTGLSLDYTQVVYEGTLSASFANELNPQDFVVGNLSVSVTNIPEEYRGKLSIWVDIDGYVENSLGASTYGNIFMNPENGDYEINAEHQSYSDNKNIAVASVGVQKVRIFLKYNVDGLNILQKNEAALGYSVSIQWGAPTNGFVPAYVVGNSNQWSQDDEYMMAPNINKANSEGWEWVYNNLPGSFEQAKCMFEGTMNEGANINLDGGKTYDVYWNGNYNSAPNFQAIAQNP